MSDREGISVQLKELADQVAQMEVDKVADIEREGWVRTDIVGFSRGFDSDEDDFSDKNDDGNAQDNNQTETKDINDEHSENGINDQLQHTL